MSKKKTIEEFISDSIKVHTDLYDYSKSIYLGAREKLVIICKEHGEFSQKPNDHLNGHGCKLCGDLNKSIKQRSNLIKYDYSKFDYSKSIYVNSKTKIEIRCIEHDEIFHQIPYEHNKGHISCKRCQVKSKGELLISSLLNSRNISYIREKKFNDCIYKRKRKLKFDFYLPTLNTCIEFDGKQHFMKTFSDKEFERTKICDQIKNNYCLNKNIPLIRISYKEIDNIDEILIKLLDN